MVIRDGDWVLHSSDIKRGKYVWRMQNPDGTVTFRTDTHVDPILEANKEQRNITSDGWAGDWHHIAAVPKTLAFQHLVEAQSQGDDKYVSKWLNDSDNSAWRVKTGRV